MPTPPHVDAAPQLPDWLLVKVAAGEFTEIGAFRYKTPACTGAEPKYSLTESRNANRGAAVAVTTEMAMMATVTTMRRSDD